MTLTKRLAILLIVLAMLLGMAGSALANEQSSYSIAIGKGSSSVSINGNTYYAYRMFDYDANAGGPYPYKINSDFDTTGSAGFTFTAADGTTTYRNADLITYVANSTTPASELNRLAGAALKHAIENSISFAGSDLAESETAVIDLADPGYYLVSWLPPVQEEQEPDMAKQSVTALVAVTPDDAATPDRNENKATINVKTEVPSIDKVIVNADSNDGNEGSGTAQDVGSKVDFKLTSKVPDRTGYTSYSYIVHDTMSSGLTPFDGVDEDELIDVAIAIGGVVYEDFEVTHTNDQSFTITFNNLIDPKYKTGDVIVITYSAIINENALTSNEETNTVYLEYSNNPYDQNSTGTTPPDIVYVYDFKIGINKVDAENKNPLQGAEFVLYRFAETTKTKEYYRYDEASKTVSWYTLDNGETLAQAISAQKVTQKATGASGEAEFAGLDAGTYYLHETKAPAGYNLPVDDTLVVIEADYGPDGKLAGSSNKHNPIATIENTTVPQLPETGGTGTTVIYIGGSVLVLFAVVLLIIKRRANTSK